MPKRVKIFPILVEIFDFEIGEEETRNDQNISSQLL